VPEAGDVAFGMGEEQGYEDSIVLGDEAED